MSVVRHHLSSLKQGSAVEVARDDSPSDGRPTPTSAVNEHLSHWIDLFRWTAALSVVIAHAGNRFVQPIDSIEPAHRSASNVAYAFLMGFSHPGIMIFFVISGFLVGGTAYREAARSGKIDFFRFLSRRLVRLWIVIVPALLFTLLADTVGMQQGAIAKEIYDAARSHRVDAALCNIMFLQTVACDPYGTDNALWTLYNEFWYYLLFVFGVTVLWCRQASHRTRSLSALSVVAISIASVFQREGSPLLPYFAIWLLGAWAATVKKPLFSNSPWAPLIVTLSLVLLYRIGLGLKLWENAGIGAFALDLAAMSAFAVFLAAMRFNPIPLPRLIARPSVVLASFSFSLYCFHLPLMNLIAALMQSHYDVGWRDVAQGSEWLRLLAELAFVLAFTFVISRVTEARTDGLRRLFLRT